MRSYTYEACVNPYLLASTMSSITKIIIAVVVVLLIAGGAWWWYNMNAQNAAMENMAGMTMASTTAPNPAATSAAIDNRDDSDASLEQDMTDINTQMGQMNADASSSGDVTQ